MNAEASSTFNDTKGWCRVGSMYLTKESARLKIVRAISLGMEYYAALMSKMLEGSIGPTNKLIKQVREAWEGLAKPLQDVVIEQGLSICYSLVLERVEQLYHGHLLQSKPIHCGPNPGNSHGY